MKKFLLVLLSLIFIMLASSSYAASDCYVYNSSFIYWDTSIYTGTEGYPAWGYVKYTLNLTGIDYDYGTSTCYMDAYVYDNPALLTTMQFGVLDSQEIDIKNAAVGVITGVPVIHNGSNTSKTNQTYPSANGEFKKFNCTYPFRQYMNSTLQNITFFLYDGSTDSPTPDTKFDDTTFIIGKINNPMHIRSKEYADNNLKENLTVCLGALSASAFTITAIDNYTSAPIINFNATINGSIYATVNGTVIADILSNSSYVWNITVSAYNYNDSIYLNYNVSSDINALMNYKYYRLNVTARDVATSLFINDFTLNITNPSSPFDIERTTSNGSIYEELHPFVNYTLSINAPTYLQAQDYIFINQYLQEFMFNLSSFGVDNCSNSIANATALNISFFDIVTGVPARINGSIQIIGQSNYQKNLIDIYSYKLCVFPDYANLSESITIQYAPFGTLSSYSYSTYLNNITQFLSFYTQSSASSSTIFTIKDKNLGTLLENAQVIMQRLVGGIWTTVEQRYSDNTGRVQFYYEPNVQYRFLISKDSYIPQTLTYNPILFSSYDIAMSKVSQIDTVPDFNGITYSYSPKAYFNGSNSFNFSIQTPYNFLNSYGYIIQWCNNATYNSGTNSGGSNLYSTFSINCTSPSYLYVHYWYNTDDSGTRNFTDKYNIIFPYGNYTWMSIRDKDYGMGLLEKIVILTFISVVIVGIAAMAGQAMAGLFLALCVYGFFTYVGFIPIWLCLIMVVPALILIAGKGY